MDKGIPIKPSISDYTGNLFCPECATVVELTEGTWMPWCNRCTAWLCSTACATKHRHAGH